MSMLLTTAIDNDVHQSHQLFLLHNHKNALLRYFRTLGTSPLTKLAAEAQKSSGNNCNNFIQEKGRQQFEVNEVLLLGFCAALCLIVEKISRR